MQEKNEGVRMELRSDLDGADRACGLSEIFIAKARNEFADLHLNIDNVKISTGRMQHTEFKHPTQWSLSRICYNFQVSTFTQSTAHAYSLQFHSAERVNVHSYMQTFQR